MSRCYNRTSEMCLRWGIDGATCTEEAFIRNGRVITRETLHADGTASGYAPLYDV